MLRGPLKVRATSRAPVRSCKHSGGSGRTAGLLSESRRFPVGGSDEFLSTAGGPAPVSPARKHFLSGRLFDVAGRR